jgi:hypothetical protein
MARGTGLHATPRQGKFDDKKSCNLKKRHPVRNSKVSCDSLIDQVRALVSAEPLPSAESLTELTGQAFEQYADTLLGDLNTAEASDAWIRREFSEGLDAAGAALRSVLAECRYRHSVSQGLQRKMFEAETRLRSALKARRLEPSGASRAAAS